MHIADAIGPGDGDLADFARPDVFHCLHICFGRSPMQAYLNDPVVAFRGIDHFSAFHNRNRQRLFHVNIFSRLAGHDRLDSMPMVRRCDDHCIDILAVEQTAKILITRYVGAELLGHPWNPAAERIQDPFVDFGIVPHQVRLVNIAKGDNFGVIVLQKTVEKLRAAVAHADKANADFFISAARCSNHRSARNA